MTTKILVIDDEPAIRFTLQGILEDEGYEVDAAEDGQAGLAKIENNSFDLVISDLRMPNLDGMGLLQALQNIDNAPQVIMITAHGSERHAVEAIKNGAYDYFRKPFENEELLAVVRRATNAIALARENERLQNQLSLSRDLIFRSEAMNRLATLIARVAPRHVTVLIHGESGTGKEKVCQSIVRASKRTDRPYLTFNCAALTPELAQAELFGHKKGAFTGADQSRSGLFREADQGTLLLDEIGELDATTQAKLLRVLQEGEVQPVGEDHPVKVDVRILAATHRNLEQLVKDGKFREDLYYRLKVVTLTIPPLRERKEDIELLATHFIEKYTDRFQTGRLRIPSELLPSLQSQDWPGNVRELENAIESMVALSLDGEIDMSLLPQSKTTPTSDDQSKDQAQLTLKQRIDAYERGLVAEALKKAKQNVSAAARALGVSRVTLHDKLKKHNISTNRDDED